MKNKVFIKPNSILHNDELCVFECKKLSKVYPCFCDLSCIEYGDCCKLYANGCENYFRKLASVNYNEKNISDYESKILNISNINKTFIIDNNNMTSFNKVIEKNFVTDKLPINVSMNKTAIEKYDHNGRCCNNEIGPFNCFCDSKCELSGDCCNDYKHCKMRNLLSEEVTHNSLIQRLNIVSKNNNNNNYNSNDNNTKLNFSNEFENIYFNKSREIEQDFDIYNRDVKKVLDKRFISNKENVSEIIKSNKSSLLNNKKIHSKKLDLFKVNTLTPQLDMKYINISNDIYLENESMKFSNSNINTLIKSD